MQNIHVKVLNQENFLEDTFKLELSSLSKQVFNEGNPGQGYIGLVELMNPEYDNNNNKAIIHLIPAFNKDDGLLKLNNKGQKFKILAESVNGLGANTGDLHTRSAGTLKLGHKAGRCGYLMGFGLWKNGVGIKFLSQEPSSSAALIPHEYLLIKDNLDASSEIDKWRLIYVDSERNCINQDINAMPGLEEAILDLSDCENLYKIPFEDRKKIELLIEGSNDSQGIKFIKNRSSSQNMFSFEYAREYQEFFSSRLLNSAHGSAHQMTILREIPLPIFQKIVDALCDQLLIKPLENLHVNPVVPNDRFDNCLRDHLRIENEWIQICQSFERCGIYFNQLEKQITISLMKIVCTALDADNRDIVIQKISDLINKNLLTQESVKFLVDNPSNFIPMSNILLILEENKIPVNDFNLLKKISFCHEIDSILVFMVENKILNSATFDSVTQFILEEQINEFDTINLKRFKLDKNFVYDRASILSRTMNNQGSAFFKFIINLLPSEVFFDAIIKINGDGKNLLELAIKKPEFLNIIVVNILNKKINFEKEKGSADKNILCFLKQNKKLLKETLPIELFVRLKYEILSVEKESEVFCFFNNHKENIMTNNGINNGVPPTFLANAGMK